MGASLRHWPPAFRLESGRFAFGAVAALVLALGAAVPARAQDGDERTEEVSPETVEIVIEGEAPGARAPTQDDVAAASVITREDMEQSAGGVPDLVDRTVGVRVREVGGFGSFSTTSIRGSSADQVRVTLDGIPLNRATNNTVDLSIVSPESLERIEIYRGLAPLSVGGSAIGGVVALQTRRPEKDALEFFGGAGSYGYRRGGLYAARAQKGERWSAAVGLSYEGAENDYKFTADPLGTPLNPADDVTLKLFDSDYDQGDALLGARLELPGNGSLSLTELFHVRETGVLQNASSGLPSGDRLFELASNTALILDLPELTPRSQLSTRAFVGTANSRFDQGGAHTDDWDTLAGAGAGYGYDVFDRLTASAYAQYSFERFAPGGDLTSGIGPAGGRHFTTLALGTDVIAVPEELLLVFQGRYEDVRDTLRTSNSPTAPASGKADRRHLTGRAGVRWRPTPPLTVSSNLASAARFPELVELFGLTGFVRGDPNLKEETSVSVDAGAEFSLRDRPWCSECAASARYFYVDTNDLISFRVLPSGGVEVVNLLGSKTHGLEFEARWSPLSWIRWSGNVTWLYARQKENSAFDVPLTPRWQAYTRITLEKSFLQWHLERAGVWTDYEFVASNFLGPANLSEAPARSLVGAGAFADLFDKQLSVLLEARNLTDERDLFNFRHLPLPGFTVVGSLRWRAL